MPRWWQVWLDSISGPETKNKTWCCLILLLLALKFIFKSIGAKTMQRCRLSQPGVWVAPLSKPILLHYTYTLPDPYGATEKEIDGTGTLHFARSEHTPPIWQNPPASEAVGSDNLCVTHLSRYNSKIYSHKDTTDGKSTLITDQYSHRKAPEAYHSLNIKTWNHHRIVPSTVENKL